MKMRQWCRELASTARYKARGDYWCAVGRNLARTVGDHHLSDYTPAAIAEWVENMGKPQGDGGQGFSSRLTDKWLREASSIFRQAVDRGVLASNPCDGLRKS